MYSHAYGCYSGVQVQVYLALPAATDVQCVLYGGRDVLPAHTARSVPACHRAASGTVHHADLAKHSSFRCFLSTRPHMATQEGKEA